MCLLNRATQYSQTQITMKLEVLLVVQCTVLLNVCLNVLIDDMQLLLVQCQGICGLPGCFLLDIGDRLVTCAIHSFLQSRSVYGHETRALVRPQNVDVACGSTSTRSLLDPMEVVGLNKVVDARLNKQERVRQ